MSTQAEQQLELAIEPTKQEVEKQLQAIIDANKSVLGFFNEESVKGTISGFIVGYLGKRNLINTYHTEIEQGSLIGAKYAGLNIHGFELTEQKITDAIAFVNFMNEKLPNPTVIKSLPWLSPDHWSNKVGAAA